LEFLRIGIIKSEVIMKKSSFISLAGIALVGFVLMSFSIPGGEKKAWEIPANYKTMENPYADDASLLKIGKMAYAKHCKSCHGNKGLGDGPKAKQQETPMHDISSAEFQTHSDGEIFYMSIVGRDEMPNYEKKIVDEEDRWALVNYLRTLKK
jgi:mono/diheme cytochrome c family protein